MNGMLFDVNDPAIIVVGYRVNSVCATQFRQWATSVPVISTYHHGRRPHPGPSGVPFKSQRRKNSMAAQREVQQMSLHPCSREQKLAQIALIRKHSAITKETANLERSKKA